MTTSPTPIDDKQPRNAANWAQQSTRTLRVDNAPSGSLNLNANFAYQTKVYFDGTNQFPQGGYGLLNLRSTWTTPSGDGPVS